MLPGSCRQTLSDISFPECSIMFFLTLLVDSTNYTCRNNFPKLPNSRFSNPASQICPPSWFIYMGIVDLQERSSLWGIAHYHQTRTNLQARCTTSSLNTGDLLPPPRCTGLQFPSSCRAPNPTQVWCAGSPSPAPPPLISAVMTGSSVCATRSGWLEGGKELRGALRGLSRGIDWLGVCV